VKQCVLNDFGDGGGGEEAVATAFVEKRLDAVGEELVKFLFVFGGEWLVADGEPGVGFKSQIADELGW
jgi:hypothetical protein